MANFYGVSHVDVPVTQLPRSLRIYRDCLGFALKTEGDGFADIEAPPLLLRLLLVRKPEHRASVRVHAASVEEGLEALLGAGCTLLCPTQRTPRQELLASVRDPDDNTLTVWRPLTEDEYDVVPALPKELRWTADAEQLLQGLLRSVPALFRALARYKVTREAEYLAAGTRTVTREEVIRGFILASPRVTRGRNRKPLLEQGIDVDRYQADWDAD